MITNPLALIGLVALPALLTIYLLRNRVKHRTVSSLMLWTERVSTSHGGSWVQRNRLPLLFFLELLILLLLIWAATNPMRLSNTVPRPLIVVLDNSASMSARGPDGKNSAERALQKLPKLIRKERYSPVRVLLASAEPRWLSDDSAALLLAGKQPEEWNLRAADCAVDKALLIARENSTAKLLMVSDARPEQAPGSGTLRWLAFGAVLPNAGFIHAVRSDSRCMIELAGTGTTELTLKMGDQTQTVSLELPARKIYQLTDDQAEFEVSLPSDALEMDNHILLLPKPKTRVSVQQSIANPALQDLVARGVEATGFDAAGTPEIIFTDSMASSTNLNAWIVHLVPVKQPIPFTGPFVLDRASPVLSGLAFEGLVWAGSESNALPGMPLVLAGNTPLLSRQDDLAGRPHFYLQIDPALSTLQHSPMWPTLFWNLLKARAAQQPGSKEVNFRPGMSGVPTEIPGRFELESNGAISHAVYNFMDAEESDLSGLGLGDDGDWLEPKGVEREYTALAPLLILAALVLLFLHQFLLRHENGGAR